MGILGHLYGHSLTAHLHINCMQCNSSHCMSPHFGKCKVHVHVIGAINHLIIVSLIGDLCKEILFTFWPSLMLYILKPQFMARPTRQLRLD